MSAISHSILRGAAVESAHSLTGGGQVPSPVSFTMPTPPSTNHLFKNVKQRSKKTGKVVVRRARTKTYDDWLMQAKVALKGQAVPSFDGPVMIIMGVERSAVESVAKSSDLDNKIKASWDALTKFGVLADDTQVMATALSWQPPANGLTRFQIRSALDRVALVFHPARNGSGGAWIVTEPQQQGEDHGDFAL